MIRDAEIIHALIRNRLSPMIRKTFETLNEGTEFMPSWHHDAIAYRLEECERGNINRLIILMPPRYLKSEIGSVAFPAWVLGNDPTRRVICISYSDELARTFSRRRRQVMDAPWYSRTFAGTKLSRWKNSETEIETTRGGGCYATSVGGTLTGRGGNFLIIDDPIKTGAAMSVAERKAVNEWFRNTLYSRLNHKKDDVIIIIMQRVHIDDLAGFVQDLDDWEILELPAIATEEAWIKTGPGDDDCRHRLPGEPLHADREDLETLRQIEKAIGSYAFASQYQQAPVPMRGNIIRRDWLTRYDGMPPPHYFDTIVQSWDTAAGTGASHDFSVCTTWGTRRDGSYLLHVFRERLEFPNLLRAVKEQSDQYHPRSILIELSSSGTALVQTLMATEKLPITKIPTPSIDKETRLAQVSPEFESKRVYFPKEAPWLAELEDELLSFPEAKFDDQVDSITQFLLWLRDPQRGGRKLVIASNGGARSRGGYLFPRKRRQPHPQRDPKKPPPRRF